MVEAAIDLSKGMLRFLARVHLTKHSAYQRSGGRRELASAVLLLRSSHKALETAVQSGNASGEKQQLLEALTAALKEVQDCLAQLPAS